VVLVGAGGAVVVLFVFVVLLAMLYVVLPFGVMSGVWVWGVVPSREGGLG
jgi:hypothetical protein